MTKAVGYMSNDPDEADFDDLTSSYKSAEGSLSERMAVIRALRQNEGTWMTNRLGHSLIFHIRLFGDLYGNVQEYKALSS